MTDCLHLHPRGPLRPLLLLVYHIPSVVMWYSIFNHRLYRWPSLSLSPFMAHMAIYTSDSAFHWLHCVIIFTQSLSFLNLLFVYLVVFVAMHSYFHERLPSEVLQYIFSFLRERDLVSISQTCRRFNQIASTEKLW